MHFHMYMLLPDCLSVDANGDTEEDLEPTVRIAGKMIPFFIPDRDCLPPGKKKNQGAAQSITQASLVPAPPGPDVPTDGPVPFPVFNIDPDCSWPSIPDPLVEAAVAAVAEGWLRRIDPILSFFISRRWYTFRRSWYCRINPS